MATPLPIFNWPGSGGGSGNSAAPSPATPTTPTIPNPTQGNQTQPAQAPAQQTGHPNFTASDNTGVEIQAVNPPLTPDQIVGVYDTPLERPALPTLKLENIKAPQVKNKSIQGHLKAIESKLISTEKLMKDVIKLQRLHLITEKEFFQRKTELYQNTFEEYLLDKTIDFGKKKKGCTCINLPENVPAAAGAPVTPPGPPGPSPNPVRQPQQQTQTQTQTQTQQQRVPQTQGKPDTAPSPKAKPWWQQLQLPPMKNPFPNGLPIPPFPKMPDLEGLGGLAAATKSFFTPQNIAIGASVLGAGAAMRTPSVMPIQPFGKEYADISPNNIDDVPDAGTSLTPMLANASGRIINYSKGGFPGGDLELYNSQSSNFFNNVSNSATQIASDIPLGPHTPLPHPGYVKPQGGHIPRPNLRGMPGPMGNPMPWGWQPTLLAKGAIVNAADGKMFGPSWMPWNWGKMVDDQRKNNKGIGAEGRYSNVTDPEMRRMLGLPPKAYSSGGIASASDNKKIMNLINSGGLKSNPGVLNQINPFAHILSLSNKVRSKLLPAPKAQKPKMPSLPPSAKQIMQYPEGVSTGVGGGNAGASRDNRRSQTAARPISRPVSATSQTPTKPVDPYANDLAKYNQLISEGKTDEAEKLGMKIWETKHKDTSMMKPKTDNPLMTSSLKLESAQNNLMNNNTSTEKLNNISQIIPLPPIQKNIPKPRSSKASDDSTLAPPPSPSSKPSIFSRRQSIYR